MGTRSHHVETYMRKGNAHKHLVFVLNKVDLIPTWATARWVKVLSASYPTLAFHAHMTKPFGKGSLIQLLRQYSQLHSDRKNISVGFIGYPNVGKSSVINTLNSKAVCKVAPIPGETKVWQYITLMRRIFLIDCPGVVPPTKDSETNIVLKGVTRTENLPDADEHIQAVLDRVNHVYMQRLYHIKLWTDAEDFLTQLAVRMGRLLKGGEPDLCTVAKMVLADWQRGKLPWFVPPPLDEREAVPSAEAAEGSAETEKEKEKAKEAPVPKQKLTKIVHEVEFVADDVAGHEDEILDDDDAVSEDELLIDANEAVGEEEEEDNDEQGELGLVRQPAVTDDAGDNSDGTSFYMENALLSKQHIPGHYSRTISGCVFLYLGCVTMTQ